MKLSRILAATAVSALFATGALAQTAVQTPARPGVAPPPAVTAPAKPVVPAVTKKVNLNTANADELDKLPQIGEARAKAIIESRTKQGRFKNWADFQARNVVPKNAEQAIMSLVSF